MRASLCLVASGAILALAGPLEIRGIHTEFVTDIVYVTVTEDDSEPTSSPVLEQSTPVMTSTSSVQSPVSTTHQPQETSAAAAQPNVPVENIKKQQSNSNSKASKGTNAFQNTAVYHHNIHRENNSASALEWDSTYAGYAAETGKSCKFAHDLSPGGGGYGQNLAMWGSSNDPEKLGANTAIAQAITNMWYNGEITLYPSENYGLDNPVSGNFEKYGHYTQVVWAGTKKVGCHAQFCPKGTMFKDMGAWFSVCNYYPAGNMGGEYGKNVLKPQNKQTISA
ncbi:hypothetical protein MGG_03085 [Pyricularia oryzae 70-15]|uniref:SCP domain-containing protein n=3 Tax=Pyricularia oryzae TaxID=318829 RepID=G5EHI0_PYRO7|nr:uncharacterized protein MGG_03085 [Pyricularia oryzae 70-15]ELQ41001.1 hypothetical protein OOU_Y34scaffold00308g11 [Pyricularia oryzae Y34]KAI7916789.1 hypothetical protein M9X92_007742 [Pyricularia oryzae]EAQ71481.1 hypothetical protein MGCH7_ch7g888 [Pyricularia oryzae 70-15]EHA45845.1 hypothetical protein MGG_03085 [Pyricularia oryzae 70-15]KAI7922791.1 hypothetical protein M0657_005410 [Pyricularia oryzae]